MSIIMIFKIKLKRDHTRNVKVIHNSIPLALQSLSFFCYWESKIVQKFSRERNFMIGNDSGNLVVSVRNNYSARLARTSSILVSLILGVVLGK